MHPVIACLNSKRIDVDATMLNWNSHKRSEARRPAHTIICNVSVTSDSIVHRRRECPSEEKESPDTPARKSAVAPTGNFPGAPLALTRKRDSFAPDGLSRRLAMVALSSKPHSTGVGDGGVPRYAPKHGWPGRTRSRKS